MIKRKMIHADAIYFLLITSISSTTTPQIVTIGRSVLGQDGRMDFDPITGTS